MNSLSCGTMNESSVSLSTFDSCSAFDISFIESLYYIMKWLMIENCCPVVMEYPSDSKCNDTGKISFHITRGKTIIVIPKLTRGVQIWPLKLPINETQSITVLLHIGNINEGLKGCKLSFRFDFYTLLHHYNRRKVLSRSVSVPDNLSELGVSLSDRK